MEQNEVTLRLNEALKTAFAKRGIQLKSDMAKTLGYKSPYFSGVTTGKEKLTDSFLMALNRKLGINIDWILTGEGEMIIDKDCRQQAPRCVVPLVPVSAHGGSLSNFSQQVTLRECEMIASPIDGVDFAITVAGDSMSPEYPNGSIVLIKKIDADVFIEWGKAYVLDTRNGLVIKLLTPSKRKDSVRCISINRDPIYAPFDIDKDDIFGVYAVKVCLSRK